MILKTKCLVRENDVTDPAVFQQRRTIIKALTVGGLLGAMVPYSAALGEDQTVLVQKEMLEPTPAKLVQNYTNYYEFSLNKEDSTTLAQKLKTDPWTLVVSGEVENPLKLDLSALLNRKDINEHIYRLRCVEGWSMVVPWLGFQLKELLAQAKPLSSAKFVKFTSAHQPDIMQNIMLDLPYVEGLRIDEANHPLTILAVGMYGDSLPKQNGAPIRLVVPWKYGFKSIKAVVGIELTKTPPQTTWHKFAPSDYGFYANVNPQVPHPRWSQFSERQLGSRLFAPRRKTELFNGYGEQVAQLYAGMDLKHFY
jgi:sulfoxide reductase catalytic subunit YedY